MTKLVTLLLLAAMLLAGAPSQAEENSVEFTPLFDLRVRQESLDGVLYFAPEPHRNWVRFRTRLGIKAEIGAHDFTFRLGNEHRRIFIPESSEFDWDEIIIDQAFWSWKPDEETQLTIGRQNIIWDDGFLVLEGRYLDGSRSINMDGVRLRLPVGEEEFDIFAVHNLKYDSLVLVGDQHRALRDADETGVGAKITYRGHRLAAIWKNDNDPDNLLPELNTYTLSARFNWDGGHQWKHMLEVAGQYQSGLPADSYDDESGYALAVQGKSKGHLYGPLDADAGFFFYSGERDGLKPFRSPWGRWPQWSDLYIYTLIGEGGDGRVHVATWENIAAPRINLHYQINESLKARWGLAYLLAPTPDWDSRGLLMQTELKFDLLEGVNGHLLWEMLDPGNFQQSIAQTPAASEVVHFLRWQVMYTFN